MDITLGGEDPAGEDTHWCVQQYFAELDEHFGDGFDVDIALTADAPYAIEALWKLRPDRITIVPESRRLIDAYLHRVGERESCIDPRDLIHFRLAAPLNNLWGLSPLGVAAGYRLMRARQTDTDAQ